MKWTLALCISLSLLSGCASKNNEEHPSGLIVTEINPDKQTAMTKQNLLHLAQVYELSPFLYTKKVNVQSHVTSRSHPVLTVNTKNAEKPKKILATFLHEELHWWLASHPVETEAAVKELKKIYPKVPTEKKQPANASYIHLIVCHLEYKALTFYLGQKEARSIITEVMKKDKLYAWTYYQVLYKDFAIRQIVRKHKLLPSMLNLETNKKPAALLRK